MYNNLLIGNRIVCRRMELNMTLRELANKVGLSPSTVFRYEKGTIGRVKLPVLSSIAVALDVNADYLLGISDDPTSGRNELSEKENEPAVLDGKPLDEQDLKLLRLLRTMTPEEKSWLLDRIDAILTLR